MAEEGNWHPSFLLQLLGSSKRALYGLLQGGGPAPPRWPRACWRSEGIELLVAPYEADAQLAFLAGLQVRAGTGISRLLTAPLGPHRR